MGLALSWLGQGLALCWGRSSSSGLVLLPAAAAELVLAPRWAPCILRCAAAAVQVEGSSSKRSHRWQAFMSAPLVPGSQRREAPEEKNLDKLSDTLMTMFGEEVEARRVNPLQPVPHQGSARKQEMAEIKVGKRGRGCRACSMSAQSVQ